MIPYCILIIENEDDREFMENLFHNYQRLMCSIIQPIVKEPFDTDDVLQSVLIKLIDKIALLRTRDRDQVVNYIISTCKNTSLDYINRSCVKNEVSIEDCSEIPAPETDPSFNGHEVEVRVIKGEELKALRQTLPRLDNRTRKLLEGYYFLNKSMAELGAELGIKPDSVRMSLARARRKAFALLQG